MAEISRGFPLVITLILAINTHGWARAVFIGLVPFCIDINARYRRD